MAGEKAYQPHGFWMNMVSCSHQAEIFLGKCCKRMGRCVSLPKESPLKRETKDMNIANMTTTEIKEVLINGINNSEGETLRKVLIAVRKVLQSPDENDAFTPGKDITPFVASMRTGVCIPSDVDIDKIREEHIMRKNL